MPSLATRRGRLRLGLVCVWYVMISYAGGVTDISLVLRWYGRLTRSCAAYQLWQAIVAIIQIIVTINYMAGHWGQN